MTKDFFQGQLDAYQDVFRVVDGFCASIRPQGYPLQPIIVERDRLATMIGNLETEFKKQ